jgi:SOS-response transcriptional repressor LexA
MAALTKAESKVFKFVERHIRLHGYAPTRRDIAEGCGYKSVSYIQRIVDRLIGKSKLQRTPMQANGLEIKGDSHV